MPVNVQDYRACKCMYPSFLVRVCRQQQTFIMLLTMCRKLFIWNEMNGVEAGSLCLGASKEHCEIPMTDTRVGFGNNRRCLYI